MREAVRKSIAREGRAWLAAGAIILAYLAGSYGSECWPQVRDWLRHHTGGPE